MWVGAEGGAPAPPSRPSIRPRVLCHWPWRPGGREDDISGRLDYKGTSRATDSERTQPAPCSSGTRARLASLLRIRLSDCSPAVPAADRLHPRSHRHHAPLPADRLCPAANATLTPALRGQARDATEGGCCCGDTWFVRGVGGCGTQERQTFQTCAYKARTSLIHSSASGKYHAHLQCPQCAQQDKRHGKGKGLPEGAGARAAWQVDAGLSCSTSVGARSRLGRATPLWGPQKSPALHPCTLSPAHSFSLQGPRTPPGEELAEPQAAGGNQKKGDKTPGGGGANLKGDRSRLLRDLRVDTKSRAAWARLLHEHPNARKYKGGNKKGLSKGCFGLKLDRIGSMSGLGC